MLGMAMLFNNDIFVSFRNVDPVNGTFSVLSHSPRNLEDKKERFCTGLNMGLKMILKWYFKYTN